LTDPKNPSDGLSLQTGIWGELHEDFVVVRGNLELVEEGFGYHPRLARDRSNAGTKW
jgi:hypothetical protein